MVAVARRGDRSLSLAIGAAIVGLSAVLGIGAATLLGTTQVGPAGPAPPAGTVGTAAGSELAVSGPAASGPASSGPAPSGPAAPTGAVQTELFDELPMGAPPPPAWTTTGTAEVIAAPTSVDRSLRLRSSGAGAEARSCLELAVPWLAMRHIDFRFQVGDAVSAARFVTLDAGTDTLLSLNADPTAKVSNGPVPDVPDPSAGAGRSTTARPSAWRHIQIEIDPETQRLSWTTTNDAGAPGESGTRTLPTLDGLPTGALCLHSPKGTPLGWIAIDDVLVE
jgi:hypothetical protein